MNLLIQKNKEEFENVDLEKNEIKAQEQVKEEINDKKISSQEKVKAANSHIKEVDDFINNIEDIDSLKKSSPKLCQKENYDSKLDFHKSITTGGMDEFEKTEIQIKTGDYNLFDRIFLISSLFVEEYCNVRSFFLLILVGRVFVFLINSTTSNKL